MQVTRYVETLALGFRRAIGGGVVASLLGLSAGHAVGQTLSKTGVDLTTQSTVQTSAGRTVRYAVTLGLPSDQAAVPVTITDAIPVGSQYVSGSLKLPGNAWASWSTDGGANYVSVEPASGVTHLRVAGNDYMAATATVGSIPVPPSASVSGGTGGDGYRAIPYKGKVYNLYHHISGDVLHCAVQATGQTCAGYPTSIPPTSGQAFAPGVSAAFETSLIIGEFLDRTSGRLYFYARDNETRKPVVICADLVNSTSCGSYLFANLAPIAPTQGYEYFTITGGYLGTRFYANGPGGKMLCFDTATFKPCSGTGSDGTFLVPGAPNTNNAESEGVGQIGSRLYWQAVEGTSPPTLLCFDMSTNAPCAGFTTQVLAEGGMFMPTASATGVTNGFCLGANADTQCFDLSGNNVTAAKSSFASYVDSNPLPYSAFDELVTLGAATLAAGPTVPNSRTLWQSDSAKQCWDWVTNAPCVGYDGTLGFGSYFYEAVIDPAYPDCVWSLGDSGTLGATSSIDGGSCRVAVKTSITATPASNTCDGRPHATTWSTIRVVGLNGADYGSAKVTIRDLNGNVVADWNAKTSSLPVDISSLSTSGATASLQVEVELLDITNTVPFSADPPPYISVGWMGDPNQICFDAKLTCDAVIASPLINTVTGNIAKAAVSASHSFTEVAQSCAAAVDPVPDSGSAQAGTAATPVSNVATNDLVSGVPATLGPTGNATVVPSGTWPAGITLDPGTGSVSTTVAVEPGIYTMNYTLCDKYVPANCQDTTVTITITAKPKPTPTPTQIQPVPTLGTLGLVGLSGLLASFAVLRRRRITP